MTIELNLSAITAQLEQGLSQLAINSTQVELEKLVGYIALLSKWNHVYNLTAVRNPVDMVAHHILDSLAVLPSLTGSSVVDVGAGAGLPGLPLAIFRPDVEFTELESNNKKCRFMRQVILELALDNVAVENSRAENFQPQQRFSIVISRAFASIADMLAISSHLCEADGVILAMKGKSPDAEIKTIPKGYKIQLSQKLQVPGLEAERHLVHIREEAN